MEHVGPATPTVAELLADPSVTYWLKDALRALLERDPVDAVLDAELLARVMRARCEHLLGID